MVPISLLVLSFVIISSSIAHSSIDTETYIASHKGKGSYEGEDNPYVYDKDSFRTVTSSRAGEIKALPNFRQQSEMLRGLERYRITYIEMKPNSLMKPHFIDADWVLVVVEGSGHIAYVQQESNNLVQTSLEEGDVFVVPSGEIFYLINSDDRQTFRLANLLHTVGTPGDYEPFYVAGVRNPQSIFSALSREVLEAAFDSKEGVEHMLSGEEEKDSGAIIQLSKEELQTITTSQSTESMPTEHEQSPFNILSQRPKYKNNYGKIIEVDAREHAELGLLNVAVGVAILQPGSMIVPNYKRRADTFGIVISGEGVLEMACPHLAGRGRSEGGGQYEEQQQGDISYKKVRATLTKGTVFVVPTAHPNTVIASSGRPLRILCFEISDYSNTMFTNYRNTRHFLAGRNNVLKALDRKVLGKSFGIRPEEMSRILESQKNEVIVRGPSGKDQGPMTS